MAATAAKTNPTLWEKVKRRITEGDKGGRPGQWSARKAQLAVAAYKREGGGYAGPKAADNHLKQWQRENWGTASGRRSGETGERYLPRRAREALTCEEYRATTAKKRRDTRAGRQFSAQPAQIAAKTTRVRKAGAARADLMAEARRRNLPGRARMTKAALARALER